MKAILYLFVYKFINLMVFNYIVNIITITQNDRESYTTL